MLLFVVDDPGLEPGETGQLRWNALLEKLEVFTGSIWENGAGFIETVPTEEGQDINFEMNLILRLKLHIFSKSIQYY